MHQISLLAAYILKKKDPKLYYGRAERIARKETGLNQLLWNLIKFSKIVEISGRFKNHNRALISSLKQLVTNNVKLVET